LFHITQFTFTSMVRFLFWFNLALDI
jgi:hypothetical protein